LLAPCIKSLDGHRGERVEIIIVDNGSVEPETLSYFAELQKNPSIKIVPAPGQFNFSAICNIGVAAAAGDIVCLLNNDTELVSQDWLKRARAFLSISDVGIVGARLLYPDQTVQHFGLYLGMGAHGVAGTPHRGKPSSDFGPFGKARLVQEFSAVTAACLFVKRSVYDAVGGFDPELRVAYNDVDFCLKVRALGLKIVCDPDIVLIHKESKSRGMDDDGSKAKRLEDEAAIMRSRWGDVLSADPYYNPNLTLERDDFSLATKPRTPKLVTN
jgi:GT2 family glycosyltransferase